MGQAWSGVFCQAQSIMGHAGDAGTLAAAAARRHSPLSSPLPALCIQSVILTASLAAFTWVGILAWQHGELSEHVRRSRAPPPPGLPTEQRCDTTHVLLRSRCEARVAAARANAVREGMRHAWLGYQAFAWGADEIHPKSQTAKNGIRVSEGRGWRPGR